MNGIPRAAHSRPTLDRISIIDASVSPPSAVNRTTASAPRMSASSTSAICTISGRSPPGLADAESSNASDVVGENAGSAIVIIALLIIPAPFVHIGGFAPAQCARGRPPTRPGRGPVYTPLDDGDPLRAMRR